MLKTTPEAKEPFAIAAVEKGLIDGDINTYPKRYVSKHVTCLDLSDNKLLGQFNQKFVALVGLHERLTTLKLANNKVTDLTLEPISNILYNNQSLTEIDLSGNTLGNEGVNTILDALSQNKKSKICILRLANTALDSIDSELLRRLNHLKLTRLDLSHNSLSGDGTFEAIIALVANQQSLQSLKLAWTTLTDPAIKKLANCLAEHDSLMELDISGKEGRHSSIVILKLIDAVITRASKLRDSRQEFKLHLGQISKDLKNQIKRNLTASVAVEISYSTPNFDSLKIFRPTGRLAYKEDAGRNAPINNPGTTHSRLEYN